MLRLDFNIKPLLKQVDKLESVVNAAIRPAAFATSQVFYKEVQGRALAGGGFGLQAAVYQKFVVDSAAVLAGKGAVYHISWRKQRAKTNVKGAKSPDAALPYSTIGYWIEFGFIQRYKVYKAKNGQWYTAVRPEKRGLPPPSQNAAQSVKDAYYVPLSGGPKQRAPKSFIRSSYDAVKGDATTAANARIHELVREGML